MLSGKYTVTREIGIFSVAAGETKIATSIATEESKRMRNGKLRHSEDIERIANRLVICSFS